MTAINSMQIDTMFLPILTARDSDIEYFLLPAVAVNGGGSQTSPSSSPSSSPTSSSGSPESYVDTINSYRSLYGIAPIALDSQLAASSKRSNTRLACNFEHDYTNNFAETLSQGMKGIANMHDGEIGCYDPVTKTVKDQDANNPNKICGFDCGGNCGTRTCTCYGHVQIMTTARAVGCDMCGPKEVLRCQYR